jgi:hypothetical protein
MARSYHKKNESYWQNKSQSMSNRQIAEAPPYNEIIPTIMGEPFYEASIAAVLPSSREQDEAETPYTRRGRRGRDHSPRYHFKNLEVLRCPYNTDGDNVDIHDTVLLCQKAYANIPVFRNAIDVLAEFSASEVYLKGGNKTSRNFINKWLKKIGIANLISQYFLEYYRSGNVFLYRVDGKFTDQDYNKMLSIYGSKKNEIPIRYILLNPTDIFAKAVSSFSNTTYVKGISQYEAENLRNPKTEDEKLIFDNLPSDVKKSIKEKNYSTIELPLSPKQIHTSFYKKQDYEPFAVPYGFPVLDDINWKLELKKIDQSICRTVENAILLVTAGSKETGVNEKALRALRDIFRNENVGRVLVADYTTKVEFIIPDLKKILGKEKYEEVDKDIAEGLIDLTTSDDKFANQQTKISVFLERLKSGRGECLNSLLNPEIKRLCKTLGFKNPPKAYFQEVNLKDNVALKKITLRLIELGVFTAEEGIKALDTGIMPEADEIIENQRKFKNQKDEGLFVPLTYNGSAKEEEPHETGGRPDGTGTPKVTDTKTPIGQGEQSKASLISAQATIEATKRFGEIYSFTESLIKKQYNIKKIKESQVALINNICEAVTTKFKSENWRDEISECISNSSKLMSLENKEVLPEIIEISQKYKLDYFASAIIFNSSKS